MLVRKKGTLAPRTSMTSPIDVCQSESSLSFPRFRAVLRSLHEIVFPPICPACRQNITSATKRDCLCESCQATIQFIPAPRCKACGGVVDGILDVCGECAANPCRSWDHAVTAYQYGGRIRRLIHRFKYRRTTALAPCFAEAMAVNFRQHGVTQPDAIVPIPMHWKRKIRRGYNQAELLSALLSKKLNIPVKKTLRRLRNNPRQATLDFDARRRNVREVFCVKGKTKLQGTHIVLVDDVLTTGATLDAAATVLKKAGADAVEILTLARG